eukprot:CAMPEP_0119295760 /NCGR_PEP_ID=MMETSP1329-20130426/50217_1 /TAXON_ID=114041 /ORGANISM="Genus nov. species nov., Strain RCC1024" /LENGTH=958 /DNA_ID=CAMNT_0007296679 /DNA_START=1855 /DNA_END=4726 /DNA_ORIENTATION=-
MTEESKTSFDTTSYLTPNFKNNVGSPPKTVAEQRLITYVGTNKYDKQLTPRENIRILIRQFQNPHAEGVLSCPTYLDYVHSHSRESNTFVTDNLYKTLNDLEAWIEDKIDSAIEIEFRDDKSEHCLSNAQQKRLKDVTYRLVRNTYAGPVNLNKLMDPRNYEEYIPPPKKGEGEEEKKETPFTYVGPFSTKLPEQKRLSTVCQMNNKNALKDVTYRLVRNTYAGPVNLNKLMDPRNYEEYIPPKEGEPKEPFTYVGPFSTKLPEQKPYTVSAPEVFAHNPCLYIVDFNHPHDTKDKQFRPGLFNVRYYKAKHKAPEFEVKDKLEVNLFLRYIAYQHDTDDKQFRPGLFDVRYYKAKHKAPEFEVKDKLEVNLFLRYIAYHLFECHENPVEKLITKMIKIKNGKRYHKKDGFAAIIDPTLESEGTEFELDYRTDNDTNYDTKQRQCGPVGTPILYISKSKPEGRIAEIDGLRGSPVGGEIHRGNGWRVMLKAFIWNKLTRSAENIYECLTIEPPGWDFSAPIDMIHVGNVISQQLFQRLGSDIFHGMLAYADIKAIAHAGSSKLACFGQLCKLRNNPLLPNKAYLTCGALLLYKEDMEKADQEVSDDSLLDKFWIELTHAHRVLRSSSDFYELKLYELVKTHQHLTIHPHKTSHIDDEILTALSSFDSLHTYLISIRTTAETEGFTRKLAPQQWTRTPVSDERIAGIRSRLQVHKHEIEEPAQEELNVMTREQRNNKYYLDKSKKYHTDYKKAKDSKQSKQNFRDRMQGRNRGSKPPYRGKTIPDGGYYNPNPNPKFISSNPYENSDRAYRPPPKRPNFRDRMQGRNRGSKPSYRGKTIPDGGYYNPNPKFTSSNPYENSDKAFRPPPRRLPAPPPREPFGTNFPQRHTNVLKLLEEQLASLDPDSKEAALARRSLQEMMAMKAEVHPERHQTNDYHDPYRDLYEEEHKSHYQGSTNPL